MKNYAASDVDAYISSALDKCRPKLREVRKIILSAVPKAEESISYGVPFYKHHGLLAGFAAHKSHVGIWFPTLTLQGEHLKMLEGYAIGKKTIQIKLDQKVPAEAIRRILKSLAKIQRK